MISIGSETRLAESELAALLHGLRHRGLAVGTDDAGRIERLFRHADDWSHQRRVRALKMLLARNDAERQLIDQLAPFLFVQAEKRAEGRAAKPGKRPQPPPSTASQAPQDPDEPSPRAPVEPPPGRKGRPPSLVPKYSRWWWLAVIALFAMVLGVAALIHFTMSPTPVAPPSPAPSPSRSPETTEIVLPQGEKPETGTPPPPARWPFILLLMIAAVPVWLFASRWLRAHRQEFNVKQVAASEGARSYRLQVPEARRVNPQDADAVREAAFHLSAPSADAPAAWLDPDRTVDATVRTGGLLTLCWANWREHRPVLFIDDVAPSMAHWPGFGRQIAAAMQRQGGRVERYFMRATPQVISPDPDLERQVPLEQVLARLTDPTVVVVSDGAGLGSQRARTQARWLGQLGRATWLNPGSVETWGPGARWLADRLRVVPMTEDGLLRLGSPRQGQGATGLPSWRQAQDLGRAAESQIASLRTLGEQVFWWVAAGAVLDRVGALTMELWWALRSIAPAPIDRVNRVLEIDAIQVGADGSVELAADLREGLLDVLSKERPALLSAVVDWAKTIVEADLKILAEDGERFSLASVEAQALLVRLLLIDPGKQRSARRQLRRLARQGFGKLALVGDSAQEEGSHGRVRLERTPPPGRQALAWAVAGFLALGLCVAFLSSPKLREYVDPPAPNFRPLSLLAINPEEPLRFYDYYQLHDEVWVQVGERLHRARREAGKPTVWSLGWDSPAIARGQKFGIVELDFGYDLPPTGGHWRVELTASLQREVGRAGETMKDPGIGMRFRYIPSGMFEMGSPPGGAYRDYGERQHVVRIRRAFWMSETEVTRGQWKVLMGMDPSGFSCGEDCPVENVSWFDAVRYANELSREGGFGPCYEVSSESVRFVGQECKGYRLPTEAEWA